MDNIEGWNVRGINGINKQMDVKKFLHQNNIGLYGLVEKKLDVFIFSVVYGFNDDDGERSKLWNDLKFIKESFPGPLGICGDFNNVLNFNERIGREVNWTDIADFRERVQYCGVTDIKGQGAFYTWNNKHEASSRLFSRIDRFLVNSDWMDLYPHAFAHFLREGLFDHNPCVCYRRVIRNQTKGHFRYHNMWSLDPWFKEIVQSSSKETVYVTPMFKLTSKLRNFKKPLKELNRNKFSDIEKVVGVAKSLLEDIQIQMNAHPTDLDIIDAECEASDSYKYLLKIQHNFLSQKAKTDWIRHGDENTIFFHNHIRA
ncbi:uncharacterized protein LOC141641207 [Silene latifolia]|uniref:uncharacterized protein LOC141641207 n=1 Tax=Silene latifolia TaxID=37657 RepID=UPI003D76CF87